MTAVLLPNLKIRIAVYPLRHTMSTTDLKAMAKERGITGISKMKKSDLVEVLSHPSTTEGDRPFKA